MKIHIKYMVSLRCKMVVREELDKLGVHYGAVDLGEVHIKEAIHGEQREKLRKGLLRKGLELMEMKKRCL